MRLLSPLLAIGLGVSACDADADVDTDTVDTDVGDTDAPSATSYAFAGRDGGADSVAYSGQIFRHLLIDEMKRYLGGLTQDLDEGDVIPAEGDIEDALDFYYRFDSSTSGSVELTVSTSPAAAQATWDGVSTDKDLTGKIAGNDSVTDHVDWSSEFQGWDGASSPEALVEQWFALLDEAAVARANGTIPDDPEGDPVPAVFVTADGLDLQQLLEKFLRGAVAFSQGADDYLDDDVDGKGLLADHTTLVDGKPYTALEHQWDEGFGYFGAARDYPTWTLDEIADTGHRDSVEADGAIDLLTEACFGHSTNAAKRDRGSASSAPTDFVGEAWEGFHQGRALIASVQGALSDDQLAALKAHRDQAVGAWEKAIASTVVHYINDTLQDMGDIGTDDYAFADHAKHWGELKGFALSLQFNPRSPLSKATFGELHDLIGDAPVLSDASASARDAYAADLRSARAMLGTAYGFDAANLGDDDGENGW